MKINEIRQLSDQELQAKLQELKAELFNLRFQAVTGIIGTEIPVNIAFIP